MIMVYLFGDKELPT